MMVRMERAVAHWARRPPMRRARRRQRSPGNVSVREAPRATWVQ